MTKQTTFVEEMLLDCLERNERLFDKGENMNSSMRKHYIDNLRRMILLILIPYHTAQAWNVWGEPNYIFFEGERLISSIIVFFSPFFMPLLFVLAGISTKLAVQKRSVREYLAERVRKLFVPLLFGTMFFVPIMSYLGDKFNYFYNEGFLQHYAIFFTKYTDFTGADGGFSLGQFWFLLYLLIISILSVAILTLFRKVNSTPQKALQLWVVVALGLPLPLLAELLSIGGKSIMEYTYLFMLGFFVFSNEETISKVEKNKWVILGVGLVATILDVYLFIWSDKEYDLLNSIAKYVSEWAMVIALIGLAKKHLNFTGKISRYMAARSFLFYIYHFIWVVLFQYLLYLVYGNCTVVLFVGTILLSYIVTFVCCEISIRIPFLCFLTGTKKRRY